MNHLEDRILMLEKRAVRSTRRNGFLGLLVVVAVSVAATTSRSGEGVLRGQRVEITDDHGNIMAILDSDDAGGFLSIRRRGGPAVSIIGVGPHGGYVTVRSEKGVPVSILSSDGDGGYVTLRKRNGVPVLIGQATEHGGALRIRDGAGRTVVRVPTDAERPGLREAPSRVDK